MSQIVNKFLAQVPSDTLKGNNTGVTANVIDLTVSQVQAMLSIPTSGSPLAIGSGGTGQVTASAAFNALNPMTTTGDTIYESATNVASRLPIGTSGQVLTVVSGIPAWSTANSGTVTNVSVVSANGFAGTVATSTSTPAITLSTTITGLLKGNGTAISAATAGTDYVIPSGSITGTASNITATTNSTLTTLSALSLPGSQVTGNISGNAANVTGTVAIANGGTGQITAAAAYNALSPMTTTGDIEYESGTNTASRLPIGTSGQILTVVSGIPAWSTAASSYTPNKETFVLSSGNITNQYIDLAHVAKTNSILFLINNAGSILEGASYGYSVSYTGGSGGNTRITFLNDLATGGNAALVASDVVQINYGY